MADVDTANAAVAVASANSELLGTIVLCGLMGLVGQGIRAAVGLKSAAALEAANPSQQSVFYTAYLLFSLLVGFIVGVVAGFTLVPSLSGPMNVKTLLGLLAAGYAGTDFIENVFTTILPGVGRSGSGPSDKPSTSNNGSSRAISTDDDKRQSLVSDASFADLRATVQGITDIVTKANAPQRFIGFDISGPLKPTTLESLQAMGFATAGAYLTFPVKLGESNPKERGWAKLCPYLRSHGWGLLPIAFGYNNSPETGARNDHGTLISDDPAFANAASGQRHGKFICELMTKYGLPPKTIVYIDVESADVSDVYDNYLKVLFETIKSNGYSPGVYCHRQNHKARSLTRYLYLIHWKNHDGQLAFEEINASLENAFFDPDSVVTQVLANKKPLLWKGVKQNLEDNDIDIDICAVRDPSDKASVDAYLGVTS